MAQARGLVVAALGGLGLLAIAGIASAASNKDDGGGGEAPSPTGFTGPNAAQCEAWYAERQIAIGQVGQLNASLYDLDAARIEAAANEDWEQLAMLDAQKNKITAARNQFQSRANQLGELMQECQ